MYNNYYITNKYEIEDIVNSVHSNPHNILGLHTSINNNIKIFVVRCFLPYANKVWLIDCQRQNKKTLMKKIHRDGFFEIFTDSYIDKYLFESEDFNGNKKIFADPYCFEPVLSDLDLYLFANGVHYEIFEKLGAHRLVLKDIQGINFAVWAPNAKRVSVIGDFNNWDGRQNPMRVRGDSGVWELFIPNLGDFTLYKFEIKTHSNCILKKSDPYGNFCELRPKTASVVFDISNFHWQDNNWMIKRKEDYKTNFNNKAINIYEVHIGSWKRIVEDNNRFMTYHEFADDIVDYLKDMHYTHIELIGILEHPFDGSWGYQVTGYYSSTSRYGTPNDFMYLVNKLHENNLGIILDWVPAHFPKDEHGLKEFDGSYLYEHEDKRMREHPDWGTLIFNYGRHEVSNFLIANAIFWFKKFHIDGLRVDAVASMLYLDYSKKSGEWISNKYGGNENLEAIEFIKHMNSIINKKFPDVLMIAEESTAWDGVTKSVENNGLGFSFKWNMGWMNDFLKYMEKDPIHRKYFHQSLTFSMLYAYTEKFILALSHDEIVHGKGSLINKMPGDYWQKFANMKLIFGFMLGHPGKKLSFMGNEFAQFNEWISNNSLDWHLLNFNAHLKFKNYIKAINRIYLRENSLWQDNMTDNFKWINCDDSNRSVVTFFRQMINESSTNNILIFICNFTPVPLLKHRIGVPIKGVYEEILNSDSEKYDGSNILNINLMHSENINYDNYQQSVEIKLAPLAIVILKLICAV